MKRFLKWLLLLLVVLAVSLVVLLTNPGLIKGSIEQRLSDITGYQISLEGELDLDIGRRIQLTADSVHVSAPDWAGHENLLELGHLRLSLVTGTLFEDIIVLDSLEVNDLKLNLETDAEGKGNWVSANTPTVPVEGDDEVKDSGKQVVFSNVDVGDTILTFRNGKSGVENIFTVDSLKHHQTQNGMMQATLIGNLNERPVEYTGTIGPYENLLNGKDIHFSANGNFGDLQISGDGFIDDVFEPRRPKFNLEMHGPNIDEITAMLGFADLGSGEFTLRAKGAAVVDLYEAGVTGKVGDVALNASATVSDLSQLDDLDLHVAVNGPSLDSVTRVFGIEDWPDKPFSLEGNVDRVGGTLNISDLTMNIGGTELVLDALLSDFPNLTASRIKLDIEGDDFAQFRELVRAPGIASGPFKLHAKLDVTTEAVELLQVNLETRLGQASMTGTLGPAPDYIGTRLQVHLNGGDAHSFMSLFRIDALPEEPFNLNARVELVDNGLRIERGVLVTIEDDRLELGGLITFNPGIEGSEFDLRVSGNDLAQMLDRVIDTHYVPPQPYDLDGHLGVRAGGLDLQDVKLDLMGVKLGATGSVNFTDRLLGSSLDVHLVGDDLSALGNFEVIGDKLDIFVPGQAFQVNGHLVSKTEGWAFNDMQGRIGATDFDLDLLISNQDQLTGSNIGFSVEGPGLNQLLVDENGHFPIGAYKTDGQILLAKEQLNIRKLNFSTEKSHGELVLDIGWPIGDDIDLDFDFKVQGSDIRELLPDIASFRPNAAKFDLEAVGKKHGKLLSLERLQADIGNLEIITIGDFEEDVEGERMDFAFSIVSPDISQLGRWNDEPLPAGSLDVKADFSGNAHAFAVQNIDANFGESHLAGSVDVSLTGSKPVLEVVANSNKIDIRPFIDPDGTGEADDTDEDTEPVRRERLIPATPFPLEALSAADMSLRLRIAEVQYWKASSRNLVLEAEMKAGNLDIPVFSFEAPNGNLSTSLSVRPTRTGQADVKIDLAADDLIFNRSGLPEEDLHELPALNIDFQLAGKGGNLQELAGSTNGSFFLESSGGTLVGVDMSILEIFILDEIFKLLMPKSAQSGDSELSCLAAILKVEDGVIKTDPGIAFTTDRMAIITKGTLDLNTEKMKFNFNATPTNALKISAGELFNPYILIGGTLSNPEVGLDPSRVILHGGAAIGTAGVSVLAKGLLDRVGNAMPLCEEMQAKARQRE